MTQVEDMQRQAAESGQTFDIDQAEQYAMDTVLGQRRDWYVGIGPSIPRSSYLLAQAQDDSSSSGSSSTRVPDPVISELQAALAAQQAQMEAFQRQFFAYTQQHPSPMQTSPAMMHPGTTPPSASMPNVQTPPSASMPNVQTPPSASMPNADQTPGSVEFQRHRSSGSASGRQGARARSGGREGRAFQNWQTSNEKGKQKE